MKKELAAGILLAVLIVVSAWNVVYLDRFVTDLTSTLTRSHAAAENGDWETARSLAEEATKRWNEADGYTHIFIRHPEIDSTADAFYELSQVLLEEDEGYPAAFGKLHYHLASIRGMEYPTLGSIL